MYGSAGSEIWQSLGSQTVRWSHSARVPRSSLADVHREFVHHIVGEEAED